jgi:YD repeat-containing protein
MPSTLGLLKYLLELRAKYAEPDQSGVDNDKRPPFLEFRVISRNPSTFRASDISSWFSSDSRGVGLLSLLLLRILRDRKIRRSDLPVQWAVIVCSLFDPEGTGKGALIVTGVVLPGTGGTVTLKYDGFGRRVQKAFAQNSTTTITNYSTTAQTPLRTWTRTAMCWLDTSKPVTSTRRSQSYAPESRAIIKLTA